MKIFDMILIIMLNTPNLSSKHRHQFSTDDSFENLLYYQGCDKKAKKETKPPPSPVPLLYSTVAPPKSNCPCPRMCFSVCCDCGDKSIFMNNPNIYGPVSSPTTPIARPLTAMQPPTRMQGRINPMLRPKMNMFKPGLPPIGGRRSNVDVFTHAKENIRGLISQDEDIKKILRDLVRVTMQKMILDEKLRQKQTEMTPAVQNDEEAGDYVE